MLLRIDDSHHAQFAVWSLGTVVVDRVCVVDGDVEDSWCPTGSRRHVARVEAVGEWLAGFLVGALDDGMILSIG